MTKHDKNLKGITRRDILVGSAVAGTGLVVGYSGLPLGSSTGARDALAAGTFNHQLFLTMDNAGIATVHITKAEIGQHIGTALAQAVAEELEVDWNDVRIDYPDSDPKWGLMITGGSWSVNWTFDRNSRIGASARIALIEAAAKMMGVPAAQCSASNSVVTDSVSGANKTYSQILSANTIDRTFSEDEMKALTLKKFGEYKVVGKSMPALDIPDKLTGVARYGIDCFVPNMVYGQLITQPTRFGAVPLSADDSAAKSIDGYVGVKIIPGDLRGFNTGYVVAYGETFWAAEKAAAVIKVDWDKGPHANVSSEDMTQSSRDIIADESQGFAWVIEGDTTAALKNADTIVEAEYQTSTGYHGMMEPMNMVAMETNGVWHLYTGTQWPSNMRDSAAAILEVDPKNVIVHQQYSGTGFGRRNEMDIAVVALAARAIGRPVKLCYTREQDIGFDYHQSQSVQRVKGSIKDGKINAMEHDVVTGWALERAAPGFMAESVDKKGKVDQFAVNGADHWYDIPNHYVRTANNYVIANASPSGFLRAVAPNWTWWANECFVDECAHKAGIDPLDMRLSMFNATGKNAGSAPNSIGGSHRLKNVLLVAAGKAGYGVKPLPENTAMGIAAVASQERGSPTWTAGIAEVHVDPSTGQPKVTKLTIAMDVGTAVNPDGVKAQIEGSSLYGLSRVLYEDITMKDGSFEQGNFDTWTPMRINQAPDIDVTIVQNGHYPAGCGEPATTVVGPAVANAIFNATGARVRSWPITAEKVKAAMKGA